MSLVFTLMTSETRRQTGRGGEGVHYPRPVNHEIHHVGACLFAYVLLFRRIFSFIYSLLSAHLWERVNACVCVCVRPSEKVLKNPPQGPSHIWLRIDDLYLQVKYPVGLTGAPALHTITSILRLCLELS